MAIIRFLFFLETVKNKKSSLQTINRFKRNFDTLEEDVDDIAEKLALQLIRRSRSHITKAKLTKEKKGLKRDFIGTPYIPGREGLPEEAFSRSPFDESRIMEDEMSALSSSQPVGMASEYQQNSFNAEVGQRRSENSPNPAIESPAPDPLRLQEMYERSSSWEPIGAEAHFTPEDEYNYGLPDKNYERSIEGDAQSVDDSFLQNYFNQGRQMASKGDNERKLSELDSLGIGQSEIDERYLSEAKNIQEYLARSEQQNAARSLGHDSRQHNNIQVGLSPELLHENPNVWNMMDSASYTPMSQEAESLMPNGENRDGQVLQSQNSMGRVFVPLSLDNLAQSVRNEVQQHYRLPKQPAALPSTSSDRAVPNYPNIVKSFYPNVPYQTVQGAALNPPDMSGMGYRSLINHPMYEQQSQNLQAFMQPNLQQMPMMLPFQGMPFQGMPRGQQQMWGPMPVPVMAGGFPMPMTGPGPDGSSRGREDRPERKGPGTLTVKSSEDGDDAKEQQPKSTDFEGNF